MKKTRQHQLTQWLKTQSTLAKRWLRLSMLLGLCSGLLIVAQAWLLASLLHALIIDHTPREQLTGSFIGLAAAFALPTARLPRRWRPRCHLKISTR